MRVLHIYKDYAPVVGGIENHINLLAAGLRDNDIDAQVLVTNTARRTVVDTMGGVPVVKAGRNLSISSAPVSIDFYRWLARLQQDLDIAHLHVPYPPGELGQLLIGRSRRLVLTYHSDIVRQRVLGFFYRPFLKQILRRADLISVSNPAYIRTSHFLSAVADKCRVVPFGIDLDRFAAPAPLSPQIETIRSRVGERPLLLFAGKLRHYKGVDVLIDAMRHLHTNDASSSPHLLVIGDGPMGHAWRDRARTLDLLDIITFLGEVRDDELHAAYHAADIFVLPSTNRAETLGIVQLEAMACGLPLISTELGTGTSFVNKDGETGFVVSPSDPIALAQAIERLCSNAELRTQMQTNARRRVQTVFSKETMLKGTIEFYQEALQG